MREGGSNKSLGVLLTILLFSQGLCWYWIWEHEGDLRTYRSLEESYKKNQTYLTATIQKKLLNIERQLNSVLPAESAAIEGAENAE